MGNTYSLHYLLICNVYFQEGRYVVDKDFEGVGLTPYDPYHNSSFVYSGKSYFMYFYIRDEMNKTCRIILIKY